MTQDQRTTQSDSNGRMIAVISYITIVGWIIALLLHSNNQMKSRLAVIHLRQSLGLFLIGLLISVVQSLFAAIPVIGWIVGVGLVILYPILFIFWLMGLIKAINQDEQVLPVVGEPIQELLGGLITY